MTVDRRIKTVALTAALVSALGSCANAPDQRNTWSPLEPLDAVRIIVQVCLPDKTVSFEDVEVDLTGVPGTKTIRDARAANGYRETGISGAIVPVTEQQTDSNRATVRRWIPDSDVNQLKRSFLGFGEVLYQNGLFSASGSHIYLWSDTDKNQAVYEIKGHHLKDTIALDVSAEVDGTFVTYWYKPPREIPIGQFSSWHEPISQETKEDKERAGNPTWWNLTHGREMDIHPVTGNAPKMRFRLMTVEEYYDQRRFWERAQKAVAEKYYRGVVGKEREVRHYVPKLLGAIPGC